MKCVLRLFNRFMLLAKREIEFNLSLWLLRLCLNDSILLIFAWNFIREGQLTKIGFFRGAAIAQWIRLYLPSCHPGFESQAHHLRFYQFKFERKRQN